MHQEETPTFQLGRTSENLYPLPPNSKILLKEGRKYVQKGGLGQNSHNKEKK